TVEMANREDLLNAISLNSSIVNGARVVGPSVAGLMIGAVGVAMCFFLNGLSFIAVIAGLLMMRLPALEPKVHVASAGEHAWNGIVYSMKNRRVRTILLLFLAVGVFGWSYAVLMPAFARDVLGRGANGYGILMSASGVVAFVWRDDATHPSRSRCRRTLGGRPIRARVRRDYLRSFSGSDAVGHSATRSAESQMTSGPLSCHRGGDLHA